MRHWLFVRSFLVVLMAALLVALLVAVPQAWALTTVHEGTIQPDGQPPVAPKPAQPPQAGADGEVFSGQLPDTDVMTADQLRQWDAEQGQ